MRPARVDDAGAWYDLQAGIYGEGTFFVGDGPPASATLAARLRGADRARSQVWLALLDGVPAGWCEANRLAASRLEHVAVLTLAVARPYRRRGCGGALLDEAERWARRVGVRKLSLAVRAGNDPARHRYERSGFVLEGRERDHVRVDGGFEDNLIMAKHLVDEEPIGGVAR